MTKTLFLALRAWLAHRLETIARRVRCRRHSACAKGLAAHFVKNRQMYFARARGAEVKWASHHPELDLAINTGLRKGSQYSLTWDMVDFRGRMLNIPRTKNEEPIYVPLNDAAIAALRVVHDRGRREMACVSISQDRGIAQNGRHWFDEAVTEAGIKNFRWHDLRHTFPSRLRMEGALRADIADLLGHKSLTMTRRYAHLGPKKLLAVVSLLGARV